MSDKNKENFREKMKVQLSNIESFLLKSEYLSQKTINKKHLDILTQTVNKQDYLSHFEFSEKISFSEASVKYGILIQSINKLFNSNLSIEDMYEQYLDYTKDIILLNQFINVLIIIDIINTYFNDVIEDNSFIFNLIEKNLIIYDVGVLDDRENKLKIKVEKLYKKYKEKPVLKGNQINGNLIILVYIVTMGNEFYIDKELPNLIDLINYFTKYNNIYINDINLSLFLYLFIIITINLYLNSIKHKKPYLNYEGSKNNNLLFFEFNENDMNAEVNNYNKNIINNPTKKSPFSLKLSQKKFNTSSHYIVPNLYLFDNENILYESENASVKLLIFQNYLKFYTFYYLSKNKIKCTINLYYESFYDLLIHIHNLNQDKNENINDGCKINEILEKNIFNSINEEELSRINLTKIELFIKDNITNCFNSFNFLGLSIFVTGFENDYQVSRTIAINLELIKKSKKWHLQESALFSEIFQKENNGQYNSTENLINSFAILCYILELFGKNNHLKKIYPFLLLIKFNTFKCTINRDKKKQEIQIYFDYSNIKEKILFHFLKTSENILFLISKYQQLILLLLEFKQFNSFLRISQTNFISHQVNFYFKLIIKIIVDFIDTNKLPKIEIYEKNLNDFNPKMLVYIKNNSLNKKERILQIKQLIHNPLYFNKIKIFQYFIEQLEINFDIIVISNNMKEFRLLRTFDDNKLFIYINKENSNIEESKKNYEIRNSTILNNSFFNIYEYLNIIMYFKNDQEIYKNGLEFLKLIKEKKNSQKGYNTLLPFKTTLICDRFFLESKVIVDASMRSYVQSVYDCIDDLLLIAKCINSSNDTSYNNSYNIEDSFNYDIFINQKYICVCNHHKYQYKNDNKFKILIYDFLSVISSCIELIIYISKYKDMYINKFIYIIRTSDDIHYSFEYKNSNIFFKKIKEFDSLISLDIKKCYPLLCLLSNKKETEYTESNNNFYDLFLRLFLNLNKVADTRDKLNEIFLQKIHKSIFYQYYDIFILIAFSYEAINYFNEFFISNNYLEISGGEKFSQCNLMPIQSMNNSENKNYKKLLQNFFGNNDKQIMFNKICLYNYNFSNSYNYKNFNNIIMSFRKVEYYNSIQNAIINSDIKEENDNKKKYLYIKLGKKKEKKHIFNNIISFIKKGNFITYMSSEKNYEDLLSEYKKERIKYKAQNVGKRIFQITETAKLDQKYNNNDCNIY